MKNGLLISLAVVLLLVSAPAMAQIDLGVPDTVAMEITVAPDAGAGQMHVQLDLYVLNDANTLMGLSIGFSWDNPSLRMDSAIALPLVTDNYGELFLYDSNIDITNANQRSLFGGLSFSGGVPPAPERRHWASYYFTLSAWDYDDVIHVDTFEFDGGAKLACLDRETMEEYVPVWQAGDAPITIVDVPVRNAWFVSADGDDEAGTGTEDNPFASVKVAVFESMSGDTILVKPGVYRGERNKNITFQGRDLVLKSTNGAGETIFDCEGFRRWVYLSDDETNNTVIDGFTVTNSVGGAIALAGSNARVMNCIFTECSGSSVAGVHINDSPEPVHITNCQFINNHATMSGAGALISGSNAIFEDCVFDGNFAYGGGSVVYMSNSELTLRRCTIVRNSSDTHCLMRAQGDAGLFRCEESIVAFNGPGEFLYRLSSITVDIQCTDIFGNSDGDWTYPIDHLADTLGNISSDPMFCDMDAGELSLLELSPCLPSNNSCGVQMGALGGEYCPGGAPGCCGYYTQGMTGNTNCSVDGLITMSDIARLIDFIYISETPLCCRWSGDVTGDGKLTLSDVTRLIDHVYISKAPTEPCP